MIRLSMMRNYPVICENRKIGLLQSISLDDAQKRVLALVVSCGFHGKRMISSQCISSIADGFILVVQPEGFRRQTYNHVWPLIRDTSGSLVGRVSDYAIDEKTFCICAIEMIPGYLPFEYRRKIWLYEYAPLCGVCGEIVIPAGTAAGP